MNYGYSELSPDAPRLELSATDEENRYSIQLYHHVAGAIDLHGLDALEVGCGRGGGSSYLLRYFNPRSIIGIDITDNAIDFCNRHYSIEGLSFMRGDAESLQFASNSVDVIVNVESSICYPNVERFYDEVVRVLKPNGFFLYADLRQKDEIDIWRGQLKMSGLELLKEENITPNVLQALEQDDVRKQKLIDQYVPKFLHKPFNEFAGMKGSEFFYGSLKNGDKRYLSFIFRKPSA